MTSTKILFSITCLFFLNSLGKCFDCKNIKFQEDIENEIHYNNITLRYYEYRLADFKEYVLRNQIFFDEILNQYNCFKNYISQKRNCLQENKTIAALYRLTHWISFTNKKLFGKLKYLKQELEQFQYELCAEQINKQKASINTKITSLNYCDYDLNKRNNNISQIKNICRNLEQIIIEFKQQERNAQNLIESVENFRANTTQERFDIAQDQCCWFI